MPSGRTREELDKISKNTRFTAGPHQVEIARKGKIASDIKKKEKKAMKEVALEKLNSLLPSGNTVQEGLINNAIALSSKERVKLKEIIDLLVFLRDTSGQKPIDKKSFVDNNGDSVQSVVVNVMPVEAKNGDNRTDTE